MVAYQQLLASLYVLLVAMTMKVVSSQVAESEMDWVIRSRAYGHQVGTYTRAGAEWKQARTSIDPGVPNFFNEALKHAEANSVYVGSHRPVIRSSPRMFGFRRVKIFGPKELYFFNVIESTHELGKAMRLSPDEVATVLWKHHEDPASFHVLNVDVIAKAPNLHWDFQRLNDIYRHH